MNRKVIALLLGSIGLAVCGITVAQNTTSRVAEPYSSTIPPQPIPAGSAAQPSSPQAKSSVRPEDLTIEQLLDAVENFREQKEELEKKEKVYLKVLNRKNEKLKERIDRVEGETATPPPIYTPPPTPARVPDPGQTIN